MRIYIHDIEESLKELAYEEPTTDLNVAFEQGPVHDYEFSRPARINVQYYRAGQELFFSGRALIEVVGECARCLEHFPFTLDVPFSFVLVPRSHAGDGEALETEDVNLSFYEHQEVDLSPLVRDQVLLALPTRPLCKPDCRGLCANCGANLNAGECRCQKTTEDLRLAVLRNYRVGP